MDGVAHDEHPGVRRVVGRARVGRRTVGWEEAEKHPPSSAKLAGGSQLPRKLSGVRAKARGVRDAPIAAGPVPFG